MECDLWFVFREERVYEFSLMWYRRDWIGIRVGIVGTVALIGEVYVCESAFLRQKQSWCFACT